MRLPSIPTTVARGDAELPTWPPLIATRGPGSQSRMHVHHAMHIVLALEGELSVQTGPSPRGTSARAARAPGVLTAPDAPHAIEAEGLELLFVFLDPESDVGASLRAVLSDPLRLISTDERARLLGNESGPIEADPISIMHADGVAWTARAEDVLGEGKTGKTSTQRRLHPRVRKLLKLLRTMPSEADTSLEALAERVELSPGRLMHVFSESIGVPLRPYLAWLRVQRAAGAIVSGIPLTEAAYAAGFADAAHMSRTFRRMFGVAPSALQQPVRS